MLYQYLVLLIVGSAASNRLRVDPRDKNSRLPKPKNNHRSQEEVKIINFIDHKGEDGSYTFGFEAEDGSYKVETRSANGEVWGQYGYFDNDGILREASYGVQLVTPTHNQDATLNALEDYNVDPSLNEIPVDDTFYKRTEIDDNSKLKQLKKYQRLQNIHAKTKSSRNPHTQLNNIETSTDKDNIEINTTEKNTSDAGQISQLKKSSKFERNDNKIDYMEIQPSKEQEEAVMFERLSTPQEDVSLNIPAKKKDFVKIKTVKNEINRDSVFEEKVKIVGEKIINGRRAVLKKKLRKLPVTNFQKRQHREQSRSRVQTDDKPKSYITKKILRKIEESSEKREKETQRGSNSNGRFLHFPDLHLAKDQQKNSREIFPRTNVVENVPLKASSKNTPAKKTLLMNELDIIETSTIAQRLDDLKNDIDFLENSLNLIQNNEVTGSSNYPSEEDKDISVSRTRHPATPTLTEVLPEKEEFMRSKENDVEYSAVKFDFASDLRPDTRTTTNPELDQNIDILQMYLDNKQRVTTSNELDRRYVPTWYKEEATQKDTNTRAGSVQFSFASTRTPDYSKQTTSSPLNQQDSRQYNLQTTQQPETKTTLNRIDLSRKPSLTFKSESKRRVYGREKLEEKQRSDKTTTIRPQTLESNVALPAPTPKLRFPKISSTTPQPILERIEVRHHGEGLSRHEQQTQSPILPNIRLQEDKQIDIDYNEENTNFNQNKDINFDIIPAVPEYPVLLDSFAPDRQTGSSLVDDRPVRSNLPNKEPQPAPNPEIYPNQEKDDLNIIKLLQDDGQLKSSTPIFLSDLISFQKFPDVSDNLVLPETTRNSDEKFKIKARMLMKDDKEKLTHQTRQIAPIVDWMAGSEENITGFGNREKTSFKSTNDWMTGSEDYSSNEDNLIVDDQFNEIPTSQLTRRYSDESNEVKTGLKYGGKTAIKRTGFEYSGKSSNLNLPTDWSQERFDKDSYLSQESTIVSDWSQDSHLKSDLSQDSQPKSVWLQDTHQKSDWSQDTHLDSDWSQDTNLDSDWSQDFHLKSDWSQDTQLAHDWSQNTNLDSELDQDWSYVDQSLDYDLSTNNNVLDTDIQTTKKDSTKQNGKSTDLKWIAQKNLDHKFFDNEHNFNLTSWPFVNPIDGSYSITISL